jgi:hypothetical protein
MDLIEICVRQTKTPQNSNRKTPQNAQYEAFHLEVIADMLTETDNVYPPVTTNDADHYNFTSFTCSFQKPNEGSNSTDQSP